MDVFELYPDIHVNFTVFSLLPFNSSVPRSWINAGGFNVTLAQDTLAVLAEAVREPLTNDTVTAARNEIRDRVSMVGIVKTGFSVIIL